MRVPLLGRQRRECLIPDIDSIPKRGDEEFWLSTLRVQFSIKPGRARLPKDKKLLSQAENKQNKTKQHGDTNKQSRQIHIWKGSSSPSGSQKAGSRGLTDVTAESTCTFQVVQTSAQYYMRKKKWNGEAGTFLT